MKQLWEINGGKDYDENERNIYRLYIPYSAYLRKEKKIRNWINIFIHGGGWVERTKEGIEHFTSRYAKFGYIKANIEFIILYLINNFTNYNIFRILDEVTACLEDIKKIRRWRFWYK